MTKPKVTLRVWAMQDRTGHWSFSLDEPLSATRRYFSRRGRKIVSCVGKMKPLGKEQS